MSTNLSHITERPPAVIGFAGHFTVRKTANNCKAGIDATSVLNKILSNGECGCRGEDGNQ
jgi:hypothetical protein